MGRFLFRSLVAHGLVRLPDPTPEPKVPRRRMLLERLEDRLLFDAGPVAPVDADAELAQAQASQEAMSQAASIAEPAEVRLIEPLDNLLEIIADLTGQPAAGSELLPGVESSAAATVDGAVTSVLSPESNAALLDSDQLAEQLLTTADELRSELRTALADVRHELVFVDSAVEDFQTLLAGVDPQAEVFLLDANRDGVEQMLEVLSQRSGLNAIHIVSHGSMGELKLGQATLNLDSMYDRYAEQLGRIGQALADDADILIYGCNFAEGLLGRAAEESLAQLTGADVAASSDATGNAAIGGDWDLERSVGVIESNIAFGAQTQQEWQYLLAVLDWDTVDWTTNALSQNFSVGGGTVSLAITGDTNRFFSGSPDDNTTNTGGLSPVQQSLLLDVNFTAQTTIGDEALTVTIGFSHPGGVSNVNFTIFDVDLSTWTDQIIVTANNGATINPSSVTVGSTVSFNGVNKVTGLSSNAATSPNGNAAFTFNQAGITQITLVYQSGRLADPTEQFISLHDITFNVAPVLDLDASGAGTGFSNTFTEDGAAVGIADTDSLITDTDSTNLSRATITLTNPQANDLLSVSGALPAAISLDPSSTSTLIVLTGSSSLANYETAIEQIRFSNSSQSPNTTARTVTVTVQDNLSATSNTASTTISVVSVNDTPTTANHSVTTPEDTPFTFAASDFPFSDADPGDTLQSVKITSLPATGTLTLGGVAVTANEIIPVASLGSLVFTPVLNGNGSPYTTFGFQVSDGTAFSATSTQTINVTPVNDVPTGGNRTITTAEDTDFSFTTADFPFADVDGESLARVRIDTLPTDGTVLLSGVAVTAGQIITVANITAGNLKFRPDTNENGSPYTTFTFSVGDASTFVAATSTMTVNVTPVNDAPVGGNRTVTTAEDTDFTFATSDFPFSDVDGDSLARVRIDALPTDGTVLLSGVAVTAGQIITAANITAGNLKFRPDTNENGSPYTTFTFSVGDASTFVAAPSTMTVNVTPVNDVPTGGNRTVTTAEDIDFTFATVDFPFSDVDGGSLARVRIDTLPVDGSVLLSGIAVTAGQVVTSASIAAGNLKFRPDANENDSPYGIFTFSVGDATTFAASPSTMTVDVTPVNDPPIADDETFTVAEGDSVIIPVLSGDTDLEGDTLTVTQIDGTAISVGSPVTIATGVVSLNGDGTLTFTPNGGYSGPASFAYTVSDGNGGSDLGLVSGDVLSANDPPVAVADVNSTTENANAIGNVIANDSDPDGDTLSVSAVNGAAGDVGVSVTGSNGGSFTIDSDGSYTFNPETAFDDLAAGETRATLVSYTISDGQWGTNSATVTVTVTGTNDGPTSSAIGDQNSTDGAAVILDVSGYFFDPDASDALSFNAIDLPPGLSLDPVSGVISGTIDHSASVAGPYSVTVTATDPSGAFSSQTIVWTVTNPAPSAVADTGSTPANATTSGNVITNDTDPDGDLLVVSEVNGLAGNVAAVVVGSNGGSFTINADGGFTFDPGTAFDGLAVSESRSTSVSYTASDGEGGTSSTTATITVTGANDPPTSTAIPDRTNDDSDVVTVNVSSYFSDPDASDVLTFSAANLPPVLSLNPTTGAITGTLAANASAGGPYSVTITATDLAGAFTSQTFLWVVNNVPTTAYDDFETTSENVAILGNVLANDVDPDGDPLVVAAVNGMGGNVGASIGGTQGGTFLIQSDGSYTFDPGTDFDDLAVGEARSTSIRYTTDDNNGSTVEARLLVVVTGTNDVPISIAIPAQASQDNDAVVLDVASQFSDPDASDTFAFSASNLPAGLTINSVTGVISGTIDHSASVSGPYSTTVTATDPFGAATSQTFDWIVTNPGPSAVADIASVMTGAPATGNVLGNDIDLDGDTLSVSEVNAAAGNVGASVTGSNGGAFTINANGDYSFDPGTDFNDLAAGETRTSSIAYTMTDSEGGTSTTSVTVTVIGGNDAPTSTPIADQNGIDDTPVTLDVSGNFTDPDSSDVLTFSDGGTLPLGLSINSVTGVITGTLDPSASVGGPYTVVITATDPSGAMTSQTFTWNVTNPPPTAGNDSFTTAEDTPVSGSVTANDSDPDEDTLTYSLDSGPTNGAITLDVLGTFTYTPNLNFNGSDSFTYEISDGQGGTAMATVNLTVTAVNDAPTGADNSVMTPEDTDFVFSASDFPFSDVDGDSQAEVRIDSLPIDGTLLLNGVAVSASDVIAVADLDAGLLIFRPDANENGSPYTTFQFSVGDGSLFSAVSNTLTVHVTPVNDSPIADDDSATTNEDTPVVIDVLDGDTDFDGTVDPMSVIIVSTPLGATLSPDGKSLIVPGEGTWTVDAVTGEITFAPETDYTGPVTTITYQVADDLGATDIADVSVLLTPVNDSPTGADAVVTTPEETDFTFSASDFPFFDVGGDVLTEVRIDSLPTDGTLLLNGTPVSASDVIDVADINAGLLVFRPDDNENGSPYTTFDFSVGDGNSFSIASNTLTINVTPTNVSVTKSLFDSSDPNTVGSNVTIGEELCFALLVTMSEGNSTDLVLTDLLPDGLQYDSWTLITSAAASNGLLAADFNGSVPVPSVSGGTSDGEDVAFTFGAISVATDSDLTNNSFVLLVHAFVSDVPSNHDPLAGTPTLTNSVTADVSNPQPPISSNPFDVTVVEPDLSVTIDNGLMALTAGQTATYSITIANDGDLFATGIALNGSLPIDRVTFVSTDDAANFSIDGSGNFTWTPAVGSLAPSGTFTLLLTVQVNTSLDSGISDVTIPVSVTHANIEPTPANNSAADTDSLDAAPDLRLTKTDFTGSITPGAGSVYTINISNVGTQAATNVLVTETVPIGTTYNAALSDPLWSLIAPETYQIALPTLAAGAGFNVNFAVIINAPAMSGQSDIVNTVTISDDGTNGPDPIPGDNMATDTNELVSSPDYRITINDGELIVVPGQMLSYSIGFTNGGDQDGTGVVVSDTYPTAILENVVASDGGIVDDVAGTITWNVGNLAIGDLRTFTVTAKVRDTVPAGSDDFTHESSITDDLTNGSDPTPADDAAADTNTLDASPDYHIAITDGETVVAPGQSLSYTVSFLNAGNQEGTGVVISDTFPPEILENVIASDGGIVDGVAGTITWNVGNLAAGESRSFTVTAKVRDMIPAGFDDFTHSTTITDDATNGADPTPADNSAADSDTLDAQPDYQISIDDSLLSATTGQSLTYSITFANVGQQGGTGVVLANSFPLAVLTNVVASNGGVVDMTTGAILWNVGNLAAGASLTYTVTADVLSSVAAGLDDFTHSTSITDDGTNGSDPTPASNSFSDTDTLDAAPDLRLTKTDFTNSISPGQGTVYTLNVGNFGTQGASDVLVTETVSAGAAFNPDFSDPAWTNVGGNVYQYSIASLPAGASFNINFSVLIDNPAVAGQDDLVNTATIADDGTNGPDLDPTNNTATDTNTLDALPMYDIGIDDLQTTAAPGDSMTYYVNFNNYGLQNGTGVVITASFPTALVTNVITSDGGIVDAIAGTITWNVGALPANNPRTFTVTADVRSTVSSGLNDLTLSASINDDGTNGLDPDLSDNSTSDTDTLDAEPDYSITIDDGESIARPSDSLTYTINVANNGNQDGTGVVVTVTFPVTLLQDVVASNGGVVDAVAGTITWNLGDLAAGDATTLTVSTQVRSNVGTQTPSITLTATVTDDGLNGSDPTPLNNVGSDLDRLQVYAYDSFHDWKDMRVAWLMPQTQTVGRPLAPLPVDPVFSGLTEPGSTLVARIYDADGRLLGDRQVVADSAGNWLISFPNIIIYEYPHRMEIIVTPAISNVSHENGYNLRRYFHPAIHAGLVMTEPLTVASVFRNRAYNIIEAQHAANTHPLGFQWFSHAYELNTASSNVSQR